MSREMRLWTAVLAGLQILVAGSALTDVLGTRWAGLLALVVAAAQVGTAAYRRPEPASDDSVEEPAE